MQVIKENNQPFDRYIKKLMFSLGITCFEKKRVNRPYQFEIETLSDLFELFQPLH